jgi:hypothetical protein
MILEHIREVFVAQHRVDFRMGVFGLKAEMTKMALDPYKGECCVFIHPNHRQVRVIGATPSGCFMVVKFFESGALKKKLRFLADPSFVEISKMELALLLDGANFSAIDKVSDWPICKSANKKVTGHNSFVRPGATFGSVTF